MMSNIRIPIDSNTHIDVSEDASIPPETFKILYDTLSDHPSQMIMDVSYLLRSNYEQSLSLIELCERKHSDDYNTKIHRLALMLNHNKDIRNMMDMTDTMEDKRMEFIRGVFFLNNNQIEDAENIFTRLNYRKGMEMCSILKNKEIGNSLDPVIQCYQNSKNWKECNIENISNEDFLYIIGRGGAPLDTENVDVQLRNIIDNIDDSSNSNNNMKILLNIINKGYSSPYIFYLIGKLHHILNNKEEAIQWYEKALKTDPRYLPAEFNLCKIKNKALDTVCKNTTVNDYDAIVSLKNLQFEINLNNCSDDIRKKVWTVLQARKLKITDFDGYFDILKGWISPMILENNKAVILYYNTGNKEESMKILEGMEEDGEYLKYNLGVLKEDLQLLKECYMEEAQKHVAYIEKREEGLDRRLQLYNNNINNNEMVEEGVFENIIKGNSILNTIMTTHPIKIHDSVKIHNPVKIHDSINLHNPINLTPEESKSLEMAEKFFLASSNSKYSVNGLGICAVYRNNLRSAIKLFSQIEEYRNMLYCYLMMKDYQKAMNTLMKMKKIDEKDKAIAMILLNKELRLSDFLKFVDFLILQDENEDFKKIKARRLLEIGDFNSVIEMNIEDEEIKRKIEKLREKENQRKRKIVELEEYRKKRGNY